MKSANLDNSNINKGKILLPVNGTLDQTVVVFQ